MYPIKPNNRVIRMFPRCAWWVVPEFTQSNLTLVPPPLFFFLLYGLEHGIPRCIKTKHKPSYECWTRKSIMRKSIPDAGKRVRHTSLPPLGVPQKPQDKHLHHLFRMPSTAPCRLRLLHHSLWTPVSTAYTWCLHPVTPPIFLSWGSCSSTYFLAVVAYNSFQILMEEASLVTNGLSTNLWEKQNITKIHFIDS